MSSSNCECTYPLSWVPCSPESRYSQNAAQERTKLVRNAAKWTCAPFRQRLRLARPVYSDLFGGEGRLAMLVGMTCRTSDGGWRGRCVQLAQGGFYCICDYVIDCANLDVLWQPCWLGSPAEKGRCESDSVTEGKLRLLSMADCQEVRLVIYRRWCWWDRWRDFEQTMLPQKYCHIHS